MTYYIYHIPGIKIGCTTEPDKRTKIQGYTDYEILEEHSDIYIASEREIELQKQWGYPVDTIPYYRSRANWGKKAGKIGGKVNAEKGNLLKIYKKAGEINAIKHSKKVYQYDLNFNLLKIYRGKREAIRILGYNMCHNLYKKTKTCHGFIFSYNELNINK